MSWRVAFGEGGMCSFFRERKLILIEAKPPNAITLNFTHCLLLSSLVDPRVAASTITHSITATSRLSVLISLGCVVATLAAFYCKPTKMLIHRDDFFLVLPFPEKNDDS